MSQEQTQIQPEVIYANISAENEPTIITSMCVNCEKNGQTTILLTKIPMFKQIIIMSFECDDCGYKNNEIQFGGKLNEYAVVVELTVTNANDLKRDCIRSQHCIIRIPEIQFEAPSNKKGTTNTIEGYLTNFVEDLEENQQERFKIDPTTAKRIQEVIDQLQLMKDGISLPFTFVLDDPSGNSFIKNPFAPNPDKHLQMHKLPRTPEQLEEMGYSAETAVQQQEEFKKNREEEEWKEVQQMKQKNLNQRFDAHRMDFSQPFNELEALGESLSFQVPCHSCGLDGETKMCTTCIPYFKEIIVMAFTCDFCGSRSSEVKVGGEITKQGCKIQIDVNDTKDLKRDVFKSDTAQLILPDIDFEIDYGTLGGVYTTVEGLLQKVGDNLKDNNPFSDSQDNNIQEQFDQLFQDLDDFRNLQKPFKLIIVDVVDNSFILNPYHPNPDPNCVKTMFDRDQDQIDFLGIDTMQTDDY